MSDWATIVILCFVYYNMMALALILGDRMIPRRLRDPLTKIFLKISSRTEKLLPKRWKG